MTTANEAVVIALLNELKEDVRMTREAVIGMQARENVVFPQIDRRFTSLEEKVGNIEKKFQHDGSNRHGPSPGAAAIAGAGGGLSIAAIAELVRRVVFG